MSTENTNNPPAPQDQITMSEFVEFLFKEMEGKEYAVNSNLLEAMKTGQKVDKGVLLSALKQHAKTTTLQDGDWVNRINQSQRKSIYEKLSSDVLNTFAQFGVSASDFQTDGDGLPKVNEMLKTAAEKIRLRQLEEATKGLDEKTKTQIGDLIGKIALLENENQQYKNSIIPAQEKQFQEYQKQMNLQMDLRVTLADMQTDFFTVSPYLVQDKIQALLNSEFAIAHNEFGKISFADKNTGVPYPDMNLKKAIIQVVKKNEAMFQGAFRNNSNGTTARVNNSSTTTLQTNNNSNGNHKSRPSHVEDALDRALGNT